MTNKSSSVTIAFILIGVLVPLGKVNAQIEQILTFNYGVKGVRQDTGGNTLLTGGYR